MFTGIAMGWMLAAAGVALHWDFTDPKACAAWSPNTDAGRQEPTAEGWRIIPSGRDPQLITAPLDIDLDHLALVYIRLSASKEGACQLFWSREDGDMMGFSEARSRRFAVGGGGQDTAVVLFPGWTDGTHLRRLRFDPFGDAEFILKEITVFYPFRGRPAQETLPPVENTVMLTHPSDGARTESLNAAWFQLPGERGLWCGPLDMDTTSISGILLQTGEKTSGQARPWRFSWMLSGDDQVYEAISWLWPNDKPQWVRLDLFPGWTGKIAAFGIRPPEGISFTLVSAAGKDITTPWPVISHFCKLDPVWRVGRPCSILARLENRGGGTVDAGELTLTGTDADGHPLEIRARDAVSDEPLRWGEYRDFVWTVTADHPGTIRLRVEGAACGGLTEKTFQVGPAISVPKTDYVPPPEPPRLPFDVCAFYFPGWNSPASWYCIPENAPERRPALGYYDEGNPECVDWQIKWSLDHGITCYLVDWYWVQGRQSLTHWFEAYRKARYRDLLKVAIMWANHNPPGTHSREDWRAVTREWIDRYFNLPAYFRIDGKPAIFLWDPRGLLRDLGSTEEMTAALADARQMAQEAGYAGIAFVAMGYGFTAEELTDLRKAGFMGWTTYHEWEHAAVRAWSQQEVAYEDVAGHAPEAWEERKAQATAAGMTYYPVVDTGWDARPWHGNASMVITGRTPERFERLTAQVRAFTLREKLPFIVVGPLNEWGEGSYIEPNAEYGMSMLQALRRGVTGESVGMPEEMYPADMGRGPFDVALPDWQNPVWPLTPDAPWVLTGSFSSLQKEPDRWRFTVTGNSAVLTRKVYGINASVRPWGVIRMAVSPVNHSGENPDLQGRIRVENLEKGIMAEKSFAVMPDGIAREYRIDLSENNPCWTGRPARIMFYPLNQAGYEVIVSSVALETSPESPQK